jgi:hypothetical protein
MSEAKVLFLDIETFPIIARVWDIWDQNIGRDQIIQDWTVASWAAKWRGKKQPMMYLDQSKSKNVRDDKKLLEGIWKLLDEADIVVGQNSKNFDVKKLNARFIKHGMKPPSPYKQMDTLEMSKRIQALTSNKLDAIAENCGVRGKLHSKKFPGMKLWNECEAGNLEAWKEMKKYNCQDVVATEGAFDVLAAWDSKTIDLNLYTSILEVTCICGASDFKKEGFDTTKSGKFQQFSCRSCGKWTSLRGAANNLLSKTKRGSLRK